jgi:hypothetical protein
MRIGNIFKIIAKYKKFKDRAEYYVTYVESLSEKCPDAGLKEESSKLRELYEKLP